ncbi:MAG: succinyl-CoA synthetase subunit alpha [Candidatus Altiarchaeales archaeon HGW-Altiarchaeales-1]|nr:MAG: succinyl-CoA synthetase subunit alpha [Candidatus Altiarchaeales archaeon HGW-Altiarchaeales-2]PKP60728.1 MAG: succinyl-CoA synthetase subunit alpha [Candidatus Altiarchaeales archaeon HGW-Altiarchaeales-1]
MDETFNWFTKANLSKYEDKYVSIVDSKVVCADESPEEAYKIAKKKYPNKEIVLWKVPRGGTFIFQLKNKND